MAKNVDKSTYLRKDFDYTKLTKEQLRSILFENGVGNIPPITERKSVYLDIYKDKIHNRIDVLSKPVSPDGSEIKYVSNFSDENFFQSPRKAEKHNEDLKRDRPTKKRAASIPRALKAGQSPERTIDISAKPKEKLLINIRSTPEKASVREKLSRSSEPKNKKTLSSKVEALRSTSASTPSPERRKSVFSGALQGSGNVSHERSVDKRRLAAEKSKETQDANSSNSSVDEETFRDNYLVSTPSRVKKSSFKPAFVEKDSKKEFFVYFLAVIYMYFRFLFPYCTEGGFFCAPLPKNSFLDNGSLKCKPGFILRRGLVTRCERSIFEKLRRGVDVQEVGSEILKMEGVYVDSGIARIRETGISKFFRYFEVLFGLLEVPVLMVILAACVRNQRRKKRRIQKAINEESQRATNVLIKTLKERSREGKTLPISSAKRQFGADSRIWSAVLKSVKNKVVERNGIVDGRKAKVWEWAGNL